MKWFNMSADKVIVSDKILNGDGYYGGANWAFVYLVTPPDAKKYHLAVREEAVYVLAGEDVSQKLHPIRDITPYKVCRRDEFFNKDEYAEFLALYDVKINASAVDLNTLLCFETGRLTYMIHGPIFVRASKSTPHLFPLGYACVYVETFTSAGKTYTVVRYNTAKHSYSRWSMGDSMNVEQLSLWETITTFPDLTIRELEDAGANDWG